MPPETRIDPLVHRRAAKIAGDVAIEDVVEMVWEVLESGALHFARHDGHLRRGNMAKPTKMPSDAAAELTVRERVLLFDWIHAGIPAEAVTHMVVKGLIERDEGRMPSASVGTLSLTARGRAVLRAMLPDL
jgi:hypothetical protein